MTLQSLITRVEAGSGSDRQLDADICVALRYAPGTNKDKIFKRNEFDAGYFFATNKHGFARKLGAPHLTSSLDAIRALFKKRLEGWIVRIDDHTRARAVCQVLGDDKMFFTKHPDVHRAFLSATLKAVSFLSQNGLRPISERSTKSKNEREDKK